MLVIKIMIKEINLLDILASSLCFALQISHYNVIYYKQIQR